jgi:hypothetical protein
MVKRAQPGEVKRDSLDLLLNRRSPPRRSPLEGGGISPLDVLELPPDLQAVMHQAMRTGQTTVAKIVGSMGIDWDEASELLDTLVARGHLRQTGEGKESVYRPILGRHRRPRLSSGLWEMLEDEERMPEDGPYPSGAD